MMSNFQMLEQIQASPVELEAAVKREFRSEQRRRVRDLALSILTPVALLTLWEVAARAGWMDIRLFSPPSVILKTAAEMIATGELWVHFFPTVFRLAVGLVVGITFGVLTGLLMGIWRPLRAAVGPTFTALYALPKIAVLPLLLLIFGLTETPRILAVIISVFFVVQINTLAGILQIDSRILEAARAYKANGLKLFWFVLLPAAMPSIFTGLRVSAGMSVVVVTAVEFVASNSGLGYLIWNSWQLFQPPSMYVGLICVSIIGASTTGLFILLERLALPWKYSNKPSRNRKKK